MKYDSVLARSELFLITGVIAAHASAQGQPFRQRDIKFLVELFSNWVVSSSREAALPVQNTQIARFIEYLQSEGYARRISRRGRPTYRLTRVGLIDLLARIVQKEYFNTREQFFFLYYFVKNYRPRLEILVESEGKLFPTALRIELEGLLDTRALLQRERSAAIAELERQKRRIRDARNSSKHLEAGLKQGLEFEQVVSEIERLFPYELNSQKPLSELIAGIPKDQQRWELGPGNNMRAEQIWEPLKALMSTYISQIEHLLAQEKL